MRHKKPYPPNHGAKNRNPYARHEKTAEKGSGTAEKTSPPDAENGKIFVSYPHNAPPFSTSAHPSPDKKANTVGFWSKHKILCLRKNFLYNILSTKY